jgi:hypothetical protein
MELFEKVCIHVEIVVQIERLRNNYKMRFFFVFIVFFLIGRTSSLSENRISKDVTQMEPDWSTFEWPVPETTVEGNEYRFITNVKLSSKCPVGQKKIEGKCRKISH